MSSTTRTEQKKDPKNVLITHMLEQGRPIVAINVPVLIRERLVNYTQPQPSPQEQADLESRWVKDPATHTSVLDEVPDTRKFEVARVPGAMHFLLAKLWNLGFQIVVISNHEHCANGQELHAKTAAVCMDNLVHAYAVLPKVDWKRIRVNHPVESFTDDFIQTMHAISPDIIVGNFDNKDGRIMAACALGIVGKDQAKLWMSQDQNNQNPEDLEDIFVSIPKLENGKSPTSKQWKQLLKEIEAKRKQL